MNLKELLFGGGVKDGGSGQGAYRDSIQAWLPIKNIIGGVAVTKDNRFIKILEVLPVNIYLKSAGDRQTIISAYAAYLKIAPDSLQMEARTIPADTAEYVERMRRYAEREENAACREMIEDNIERCQLSNMTAKVWDATEFDASAEEKADVVIADLPCSGLGVIGTKTDIKYNASEEKIQELAALQQEILQVVCRYVKPDGTLLYSTCTMTKEEDEENVHKFLETHTEFELEQMRQCFPYERCDGFFMAKMHRK